MPMFLVHLCQHGPFICDQLLRLKNEVLTYRSNNQSKILISFRFGLICADHLALDVIAGNPGCSCVHRCTMSHSDVTQAQVSMAYQSEFIAINQTIKYLQIQVHLEMICKLHGELLDRFKKITGNYNIRKIWTNPVLKRLYENVATIYGRVCLFYDHLLIILH